VTAVFCWPCLGLGIALMLLLATEARPWDVDVKPVTVYKPTNHHTWNGIASVEVTPKGRVFIAWYTGGPREPDDANLCLLSRSDDGGQTWAQPEVISDPPGRTRAADPTLWMDPDNRLWLFWNEDHGDREENDLELWAKTSTDYEGDSVAWSEPRILRCNLPHFRTVNRPTVLDNGEWLMPLMVRTGPREGHAYFHHYHNCAAMISADRGQTWHAYQTPGGPGDWLWEPMVFQRQDGSLVMYVRTQFGRIWQTISTDRGRTWSAPEATAIPNPNTRFWVARLNSGEIALLNNPNARQGFENRDPLALCLSHDDGRTYDKMYYLDGGRPVCYPDAVETPDGTLHIVYENRKEIYYLRLPREAMTND
jgi:predicted neuraminidase